MASWLAFISVLIIANGVTEFTVHKLIQYEYEGVLYGSQVAALNFLGTHISKLEEIPRKLVVALLSEISE